MDSDKFLSGFPMYLLDDFGDNVFQSLRVEIGGMTSARVAKLINFACSCIDSNECYVEIGTYKGFTLASAGHELNIPVIGIDNFSAQFSMMGLELPQQALRRTIDRHLCGRGRIIESDFRVVLLKDAKIGVFFIDGTHSFEDVNEAFDWVIPYLQKGSVIFLDDITVEGVRQAIVERLKDNRFEEVVCIKPRIDPLLLEKHRGARTDPIIHNGVSVLVYGTHGLQ